VKWGWALALAAATLAAMLARFGTGGVAPALVSVVGRMAPVLTLLGAAGLARGVWLRRRGSDAAHWPRVDGIVTHAQVASLKRTSWYGVYGGRNRPAKRRYYVPTVRFTYRVDDVPYTGDRVCFGQAPWETDRLKAEHAVAPYRPGQTVPVRYNPARPADAVLALDMPPLWCHTMIAATLSMALGILGWVARLR
jgi:hypothetical protein